MTSVHVPFAICLVLFKSATVLAQTPGDQQVIYLPPALPPAPTEGARLEYKNIKRALRAGSGSDRLRFRADVIADGDKFVPVLVGEFKGGSQPDQFQAALILMELGDRRAVPRLQRVAGGATGKGDRGIAALALGKLEDLSSEDAIEAVLKDRRKSHARRLAALALGRLRGPGALARLRRGLDAARGESDLESRSIILALGLSGLEESLPLLEPFLRTKDDLLRWSACTAVGLINGPGSFRFLEEKLSDEEEKVRIAALEGIARCGGGASEFASLLARFKGGGGFNGSRNALESARWVLALASVGRDLALPLINEAADNHRDVVQAAAAAGTLFIQGPKALELLRRFLDPARFHDRVRRAALLALVCKAARDGSLPVLKIHAHDKDEGVRRVALLGEVYLQGARAREGLRAFQGTEYKDDVRDLSEELIAWLHRDERSARHLARASLQVELDDGGWAPSWNLLTTVNGQILDVLELANAIPKGGGGVAPGSRATAGQRSHAAVVQRPPPSEEDLRRHLDRYPYADQRDVPLEVPPIPSSSK